MKLWKITAALLLALPSPAPAALSDGKAYVLDGSGAERYAFTNLETLALRMQVYNSAPSGDRIRFKFTIYNPSGGAVFHQEGNSANAVPGNAYGQLAGISIAMFYGAPGVYKFRGEALLGADTVAQEKQFMISSPNINLIYPPNGARDLGDNPLVLRWVASGAASYRVTVEDRKGMTHQGTASGGSYSYPAQPDDDEKLVAGTVYYWKVEGLDAGGLKIAESSVYTFSVKQQGVSSRNIAVTALALTDTSLDLARRQPAHFRVTVENTGDTLVAGISLKMSLAGQPAQNSPAQLGALNSGGRWETSTPFTAFMPEGLAEGLAVACVDVFDDNMQDNCKTMLISEQSAEGNAAAAGERRTLSYQEIWEEVLKRLGPEAAGALEGYTFDSIECPDCGEGELNDLMLSLAQGAANLTAATVVELSGGTEQRTQLAEAPETPQDEDPDLLVDLLPKEGLKPEEWTGFTRPAKGPEPAYYLVRNNREWKRLWRQVSEEELPEVDFGQKMVVGVVAAAGDRAETVRILARRRTAEGLVFDYYMTESAARKRQAPYMFKAVDKESGKVDFRRLDTGSRRK